MPIESSIPLGLIINELVSNAFKHAFPQGKSGQIDIKLARVDAHHIELQVSDDGVGMHKPGPREDSLGLRLVEALADQLEADLHIHPANPTSFTILIPHDD
jgi:two-component sensor histidine kinase